jgi:hypothetical protein
MPLYLVEAGCVEVVALVLARRPLALGAVSGVLIGTVGFASEWAWTHLVFRLPWNDALLPEGLIVALIAGVTGGLVGALFALGLRGELPRPGIARAVFAGALAITAAMLLWGLGTSVPADTRATVTTQDVPGNGGGREVMATVRFDPRDLPDDARWVNVTSWQGEQKLQISELRNVGGGVYRTVDPVPVSGTWKSILRVHRPGEVLGVPIFMPVDTAIPAPAVPADARFTRTFTSDHEVLQREKKDDIPGFLWTGSVLLVMALYVAFLSALAWGVGRVARRDPRGTGPGETSRPASERRVVGTPTPAAGT